VKVVRILAFLVFAATVALAVVTYKAARVWFP